MLPFFLLGVGLLFGLLLTGRWFASADVVTVKRMLFRVGGGIVVLLVVFLAVTGRLSWIIFMLPAVLPWLMRLRSASRYARNRSRIAGGDGAGPNSALRTRYLNVSLNHATGSVDGEVIAGTLAGRRLSDLTRSEFSLLVSECRNDPQSAQVLEAYLDRTHPDWRSAGGSGERTGSTGERAAERGDRTLTIDEAYEILGLKPGASAAEIKSAHHRLMGGVHPDRGGSTYLAAKLNQARDLLLRR